MAKASEPKQKGTTGRRETSHTSPEGGRGDAGVTRAKQPEGSLLGDFSPLLPAERAVIQAVKKGMPAVISLTRPDSGEDNNTVRAEFLRFLLLGGDNETPIHDFGIGIGGAFVSGILNVGYSRLRYRLAAIRCTFESIPIFRDSYIPGLILTDSAIPGFNGDGILVRGDVYCNGDFTCADKIYLAGADIGGDLNLAGASIESKSDIAIFGERTKIHGTVFLDDSSVQGEVRFLSSSIDGSISCPGATFRNKRATALTLDGATIKGGLLLANGFCAQGEVSAVNCSVEGNIICQDGIFLNPGRDALTFHGISITGSLYFTSGFRACGSVWLNGSVISGQLITIGGKFHFRHGQAFNAAGMRVSTSVVWRKIDRLCGGVNFESASTPVLIDDWESWKSARSVVLNNFCFDRLLEGPIDASTRIDWLKKQTSLRSGNMFWPQPWEHLAKILKEMGHYEEAKTILIEREKELRRLGLIGSRQSVHWEGLGSGITVAWIKLSNITSRLLHWSYGALAGYGYRPLRTVGWMASFWIAGSLIYAAAASDGMFGPSNPRIYMDPRLGNCGDGGEAGKVHWTKCSDLPVEYTVFSPWIYSLDLILPVVELRQDQDWSPIINSKSGHPLRAGRALRAFVWIEILVGWLTSLLLVSALGRLIQKD